MLKPETASSPDDYIAQIDEPRRLDIVALHQLIQAAAPKQAPFMNGGMIGYGKFHYRYASGREGDTALISLASQKNYISLYLSCVTDDGQYLAEKNRHLFPKAKVGKSCIRFSKLADIDLDALRQLLAESVKDTASK